MSRLWSRLKRYLDGEAHTPSHRGVSRNPSDRTAHNQNPDAPIQTSQSIAGQFDTTAKTQTTTSTGTSASEKSTVTTASTDTNTNTQDIMPYTKPTATLTSGQVTITTAPTSTTTSESTPATTTTLAPGVDTPPNVPPAQNGSQDGSYPSGNGSTNTKIAIAIPIVVVGLLAIVGAIWFFLRRRRQRNARPAYCKTASKEFPASTSAMEVTHNIVVSDQMVPHQGQSPMSNVPHEQSHEPRPVSTSAGSPVESNMELGLAVAMPLSQRMSATQHDLRKADRSDSTVDVGAAGVRMPLQDHREDDDAVSVVSDLNARSGSENDFGDLSPVSSFEDDDHPGNGRGRIST